MRNQLPSSEMEYNPYCAQIDPKVANALEKIGFKRNKCLANQWVRIRWYWPFSSELVVLGLVGEWWNYATMYAVGGVVVIGGLILFAAGIRTNPLPDQAKV